MTALTNEELLVWLINEYMPPRDAEQALAALAGLRSQTPPQAVTDQVERRDDLHGVIALSMKQPVYSSSEICDAVEQYLERLSASPVPTPTPLTEEEREEVTMKERDRCSNIVAHSFGTNDRGILQMIQVMLDKIAFPDAERLSPSPTAMKGEA